VLLYYLPLRAAMPPAAYFCHLLLLPAAYTTCLPLRCLPAAACTFVHATALP